MKKRILALLLAGLLTASLASCVTSDHRPDNNTSGNQSESQQTPPDTPSDPSENWTEVNETVYVITDNLELTPVSDGGTAIKVTLMSELQRVKISENGKTSMVEKDGIRYTVLSSCLSKEDLLGKNLTACSDKTMYAKRADVAVYKYASSSLSCSKVIKYLNTNDQVTVVATGTTWCKIRDNETYYFIKTANLSSDKVLDYDKVDYSSYFTDCDQTTVYVTASAINVYKNASFNATKIAWPVKGDKVFVIATGTIDGTKWSKILVPDAVEAGQTQTYTVGYAASKNLSTSAPTGKVTLQNMLEQYPAFKQTDKTMYVLAETSTLSIRSTPDYPADNIVDYLSSKAAVKVVATATINDMRWAMIEYTLDNEKGYYFVGAANLTPNEDGSAAPLTLEELLDKYSFESCESKTVYATGTVKCNTEPKNQTNVTKQLKKGDQVTLIAKGTVDYVEWYLFQIEGDGNYYFAGAGLFAEAAAE